MCTALSYKTIDSYFGRNLDLEFSFNEEITICPRNFELKYRNIDSMKTHYAMIGMATISEGYPLFFDATNEMGLSMAGLNFPKSAQFNELKPDFDNIATFEFIPWVLSQCENIEQAAKLCKNLNLTNQQFSTKYPVSPLHWIIADAEKSIVIESMAEGLKVHDNPIGVLTNNPRFEMQLFHLNNYRHLSPFESANNFSKHIHLENYSRGMGALGLPGDLSSMSRFVRASFAKLNSVSGSTELESISQFFHILGAVAQQKGLCFVDESKMYEYTIYSSCVNATKGIYYYTTYENSQISAVELRNTDLDSDQLCTYPIIKGQQIKYQNPLN